MVKTIIIAVILSFIVGNVTGIRYTYHKVKSKQSAKIEEAITKNIPTEKKAAEVVQSTEVKYKTVYRDVIRYVKDPNRTVCNFDDDSVRLRTDAINDASNIPGFDDDTMQTKPSRKK